MEKLYKLLFLSIILNFFSQVINAQVSDSLFDLSCQYEDLIILNEEMEVNFVGEKLYLILVNITNKMEIVVRTEEGLKEFQPFQLPKKFDESYIYHGPTIRNIDWAYDDIRVEHISASVRHNDGELSNVKIKAHVKQKRVIDRLGFFGFTNLYEYNFQNLKVGDTVLVDFNYQIAFRENWIRMLSNRLFFNGKYPKKSYKLNWCYKKNLEVDSVFNFIDPPEVTVSGNKLCYSWELENLTGSLDEPAGRPFKSLPHFIFIPKPYELEYTHYDSYKLEFIPNYFFEAAKRQSDFRRETIDNTIGIKNKNNLNYELVTKKIVAKDPVDSLGANLMRYFQQYMVDSVNYDNAFDYYDHEEDSKRLRAGVDLYGYKVSDNNLETVYANMILKLGLGFFTAYPVDARVGEISLFYNPTVLENDLMFATILKNKSLGLVIPKSDKNHYYFEELPFYYENIPVLLLHTVDYSNPLTHRFFSDHTSMVLHTNDYPIFLNYDGGDKRNFNTSFRQWVTPGSDLKENYRKIQSKVNISIDENLAQFKTRVLLSGQYSTLTRCVYCKKPVDSTINPKYLVPVWDIAEEVTVKSVKPEHPMIYYPFKTTIMTEYETNGLLKQKGDDHILHIGDWFKMIFYEGITKGPRFIDYYSDFVGSDTYAYMVEFDKPVQLVTVQDTIDISNKYGQLLYIITQLDENRVLLNCNYDITAKMVGKDFIGLVREINQAIEELEKQEIIMRVVN